VTMEDRQKLREAALAAQHGVISQAQDRGAGSQLRVAWGLQVQKVSWTLQTSNSFRRIGQFGDGDVLCALTQRSDGHPDLQGAPGVLDYIVAAQPTTVLDLLDQLDAAESLCRKVGDMEQRLKDLEAKCHEAIKEAMQKLSQKLISEVTQ
jgi:hypothetical protein